jgi:hypothetical protein
MAAAELGQSLAELALLLERKAEVAMDLGIVGLEPDRFTMLGDRLIQLPLGAQSVAEAVVGWGVVGLEPDRFTELGGGSNIVAHSVA